MPRTLSPRSTSSAFSRGSGGWEAARLALLEEDSSLYSAPAAPWDSARSPVVVLLLLLMLRSTPSFSADRRRCFAPVPNSGSACCCPSISSARGSCGCSSTGGCAGSPGACAPCNACWCASNSRYSISSSSRSSSPSFSVRYDGLIASRPTPAPAPAAGRVGGSRRSSLTLGRAAATTGGSGGGSATAAGGCGRCRRSHLTTGLSLVNCRSSQPRQRRPRPAHSR